MRSRWKATLPLRDVAWSADSKRIAFIADLPGDVPSAQLWTAGADGSTLAKHAEFKGYARLHAFLPTDQSSLSFSLKVCRALRDRCSP